MIPYFPSCEKSRLRLGLVGAPLGKLFAAVSDEDAKALVDARGSAVAAALTPRRTMGMDFPPSLGLQR